MLWKKWAIWFKGAIIGLIVALIISIGLGTNLGIITKIANSGFISCGYLSECSISGNCLACKVVGFMFNLIYGFVIGALIGHLINKYLIKNKKINRKSKRK